MESRVEVDSGIVNMRLGGLRSLRNYTVTLDSGMANIDLDYSEASGGDVYVHLSSGQLNLDLNGNVNACLASSRVSSGFASLDLPGECGGNDVRVHVEVSSGIVSIR